MVVVSLGKQKGAPGLPMRLSFKLAGHGAEAPKLQVKLSGDPSEVTAFRMRHWITSFRWLTTRTNMEPRGGKYKMHRAAPPKASPAPIAIGNVFWEL
jgi:hypothetical protein